MATLILLGVDLFVFIGSSTAFGRNLEGFLGAASLFRNVLTSGPIARLCQLIGNLRTTTTTWTTTTGSEVNVSEQAQPTKLVRRRATVDEGQESSFTSSSN